MTEIDRHEKTLSKQMRDRLAREHDVSNRDVCDAMGLLGAAYPLLRPERPRSIPIEIDEHISRNDEVVQKLGLKRSSK